MTSERTTFEEQAKKISVFFFFALLDESLAAQASERAVSAWKAARGTPPPPPPAPRADASPDRKENAAPSVVRPDAQSEGSRDERVALISMCRSRFEKESQAQRKASANELGASAPGGPGSPWILDPQAKMPAWIKFSAGASEDERLAMAFVGILGFAEDEVAEGLAISAGTLRHRLGRAARALGAAVRKTEAG